tara:strand:+ start:20823 stop:22655 length:1833 start_codon:yes stop_codon:yes gene_type:complete
MKKRIIGLLFKREEQGNIKHKTKFVENIQKEAGQKGLHFQLVHEENNIVIIQLSHSETIAHNTRNITAVVDGDFHYKSEAMKLLKNTTNEQFLSELYLDSRLWIEKLIGNFSFTLFDKKKQKLYVGRDHFGSKPLYFYDNDDIYLFSSEIKYIKLFPKLSLSPNIKKINEYLSQYRSNSHDTFYEEIKSLPPSNYMVITKFTKEIISYDYQNKNKTENISLENAKKLLIEKLDDAIKQRIFSNKKNACLVSGGLDSSTIYNLILKKNDNDVRSLSMNFFDKKNNPLICDESYYQDLVVNKNKHSNINFFSESPYEKIDAWIERFDQPFNLANIYLWDKAFAESKLSGIEYIFDGTDGDTVVSHGYERLSELFKLKSIFNFAYELFMFDKKHNFSEYSKKPLYKKFLAPLLRKNQLFKFYFKLKDYFFRPKRSNFIIKQHYKEKYQIKDLYSQANIFRPHSAKVKNKLIETVFVCQDILLFDYGITQQSPFFDKKVVDLCLSLPSKFKLKHGETRYVLREAVEEYVPDEIRKRFSKSNLTHNFLSGISVKDIHNIENEIKNINPLISEYICKKSLLEEFEKFKDKTLNEKTLMNIWCFYTLNRWLNKNKWD